MKDKIFGVLQRVGRSFMLPIAILPAAGLLLGIGGSFSNTTMLETYGLMKYMGPGTIPNMIFTVMSSAGNIVFENLPVLFAMGTAIGMAKKEKEVAALSAVIAFFIMHASISAMISIDGGADTLADGAGAVVAGISSLQLGVFGGILAGLGVAALHNRFCRIRLPQVLSFFGGSRFVPVISALVYVAVGILLYFIWPPVQNVISGIGRLVLNSGYGGTWLYGLMERALIPFGLHHVFYIPFWQTAVGGVMEVGGRMVEGAQNIFFAQLADPSVTHFSVSATRFMAGKFPFMIFGLPGAALAMYRTALPEKREAVSGLLLSAALTSMVTGITEPLEFTFLFAAPLLYGMHCILAGLSYMLMHMLGVGVGMTFSGGLIDLFLFGILQGNRKTGWIWIAAAGIFYFLIYYVLFRWMILRFDFQTPGRGREGEVRLYTRADMERKQEKGHKAGSLHAGGKDLAQAAAICLGLGGPGNISDLDCCATRLRCTVFDETLVDREQLMATGASGVIRKGNGVQIVYGPGVTLIRSMVEEYLEHAESDGAFRNAVSMEGQKASGGEQTEETTGNREGHLCRWLVKSPMTGTAGALEAAPDPVFSQGMMGRGGVIFPEDGVVRAPENGTVTFVFPTRHALGFKTEDGLDMLIHVGIDTVSLDGRGFDLAVSEGEKVREGTVLMTADLEYIRSHDLSPATPVVFTELGEEYRVRLLKRGKIMAGEPFLEVEGPESGA